MTLRADPETGRVSTQTTSTKARQLSAGRNRRGDLTRKRLKGTCMTAPTRAVPMGLRPEKATFLTGAMNQASGTQIYHGNQPEHNIGRCPYPSK